MFSSKSLLGHSAGHLWLVPAVSTEG